MAPDRPMPLLSHNKHSVSLGQMLMFVFPATSEKEGSERACKRWLCDVWTYNTKHIKANQTGPGISRGRSDRARMRHEQR